ncbi:MAG: DUF4349 domain-containing protein [Candidatus Woesearchaeota archaeon]
MGLKDQFKKIKENWLIVVVLVVLLLFMNLGGTDSISSLKSVSYTSSEAYDMGESVRSGVYMPSPSSDFAPNVEERKITKSASLSTEVKRGEFKTAEQNLKSLLSSADAYLLNENVNKYDVGKKQYLQSHYQIKVDTKDYDQLVSELKKIGEVQSFNENMQDITAQYENTQIELDTEKARLQRYQGLYNQTTDIKDKISLNDKLFDQERRVKYLEDRLKNVDLQVDYSTVYFSMSEKRSDYADVTVVKFSELIQNFVDSFNSLLRFFFVIIPWAILALVGLVVWRMIKKR